MRIGFITTIFFGLFACNSDIKKKVKDSLNESGPYWAIDSSGMFQMQVRYLPPELIATKESDEKTFLYDSFFNDLKEQLQFKVNLKWKGSKDIMKEGISDVSEFQKRLNYFISESKFDFYLVNNKDTINPSYVEVERTYGQTPFVSLIMGFDRKPITKNLTLIYNAYRWNQADVKVTFNKEIFKLNN